MSDSDHFELTRTAANAALSASVQAVIDGGPGLDRFNRLCVARQALLDAARFLTGEMRAEAGEPHVACYERPESF